MFFCILKLNISHTKIAVQSNRTIGSPREDSKHINPKSVHEKLKKLLMLKLNPLKKSFKTFFLWPWVKGS